MNVRQPRYVSRLFRHRQRQDRESIRTEIHWLDIWLPRISHFSQFGLFVITIGGLYFTVLPLYQKAVLEEAIARKEIQLATSEKALEDSYARLRSFTMREFVFGTGAKCSSLMLPPRTLRPLNIKPTPAPSAAEEIFSINAGECIREEFKKSKSIKEFRSADQQNLSSHVERISVNIEAKRESALTEYRNIPQRAKIDPSILEGLDSIEESILAFSAKSKSDSWVEAKRFSIAVEKMQSAVAHEYDKYIRDQVATLYSIKWETSR